MAKIGPHTTTVAVEIGECPACKKPIVARVTASVTVEAVANDNAGKVSTEGGVDRRVIELRSGPVKIEHARIVHDCGPQDPPAVKAGE